MVLMIPRCVETVNVIKIYKIMLGGEKISIDQLKEMLAYIVIYRDVTFDVSLQTSYVVVFDKLRELKFIEVMETIVRTFKFNEDNDINDIDDHSSVSICVDNGSESSDNVTDEINANKDHSSESVCVENCTESSDNVTNEINGNDNTPINNYCRYIPVFREQYDDFEKYPYQDYK